MRPRDPRDNVRRPTRTATHLRTSDRGLLDIDGWTILAMYLEGKITRSQCQYVNGLRVRIAAGQHRDAA